MMPFSDKLDLSRFLINNLHLVMFIILGYMLLIVGTASTMWRKLAHANGSSRLKNLRLILFWTFFTNHNQLPRLHLRLLFFFFGLFLFLNCCFVSQSITTDKVTVSTEAIVDSNSKLMKTSKTLAIHPKELELLETAPEGNSFFKHLSQKKNCRLYTLSDLMEMRTNGLHRYVIFSHHIGILYYMSLQSEYAKKIGLVTFYKSSDYFEYLATFRMRRNLDQERRQFINSW